MIYARGEPGEIAYQQEQCRLQAEAEGATVVALATDSPDAATGWLSAVAMLAAGSADLIRVSSRTVIPSLIESATGEIARTGAKRPPTPGRRRPNLFC